MDQATRDVWKGFGLAWLLHALSVAFFSFTMTFLRFIGANWARPLPSYFLFYFGIGISQFVYIVPAVVIARRHRRPGIVQGLIIGASLTFLLNAACVGTFWFMTSSGRWRIAG